MKPILLIAATACIALAACNKEETNEERPAAGGELLPRSVSDDMPPYDTVKSKAPPLRPEASEGSEGTSGAAAAPAGDTAAESRDDIESGEAEAVTPEAE